MALRVAQLPCEGAAAGLCSPVALRRAALWGLIAAKIVGGWGVQWDIQWHVQIGRDSFWIPPHVMTYAGVGAAVLLSFGVLLLETLGRAGAPGPGRISRLGLSGTRGYHLAAWGIAITVLAAPIDDLWHRLFGLDVTLWSPPHLLGLFGSAVNSLACLVIAREAYPETSGAGLAAGLLSGAMLYGHLHLAVDPAGRIAYLYGGVLFYTFAILAALLLPLALVVTARLTARRWAPVGLLVVAVAIGAAGHQVARAGFDLLQPGSVIQEEVARDPASPIAIAQEMARKDGRVPGRVGGHLYWFGLLPAAVMAAVDPRRRPLAATLAYAATLFPLLAWLMALRPSLAPMVPGFGPTAVAVGLTTLAALLGGLFARALARAALDLAEKPGR
jgi:hypothetical protein